jgi:hypothetical protein
MGRQIVGMDSILFHRQLIEFPDKAFKSFMTAAITIEDEGAFRRAFHDSMNRIFAKYKIQRRKQIYKGYHFCIQAKDNASPMMFELLEDLADTISRIDLYCGYYDIEQIAIFGDASGQTISRNTFLKKYQHGFHHVCAWRYTMDYGSDCKFKLDHFQGHRTPAWADLTKNNDKDIEVYYSGSECEPLITVSDIVLKLIQLHQFGIITSQTMAAVISKRCPSLASRKITYHLMKQYLRNTAPNLTLQIDLTRYVKHPIYFVLWHVKSPQTNKEKMKTMFEWSPTYNSVINRAYRENGCVKQFATENDHLLWDTKLDRLVAWSSQEEEVTEYMKSMEFEIPPVYKKSDFSK